MSERAHAPPPEPEWHTTVPACRVLVFAPHPDDEAVGPGGALLLHRRQGDPVRVVIATDGTAGDPDRRHDKASYAALRRQESRAGLRHLGIDDVRFWGFPDSCVLSAQDLELGAQKAAQEIGEFASDLVYLPWEGEGHPDHHALHLAVVRALDRAAFRGEARGYEVWNAMIPDLIVDISSAVAEKQAAMLCHESQLDYVRYDHCMLGLNAYRSLVHARGRGHGEAFRRVRQAPGAPTGTAGGS